MKFGRNQKIAIVGYGMPMFMGYLLVLVGKVPGEAWLDWAQFYVPVAMGTVLTVSGGIKMVRLLRDSESSGR